MEFEPTPYYCAIILTLTVTVTLSFLTSQPQNHATCRISQGYSLYQVWTLRVIRFWVCPTFSVKNALNDLWPWPFNLKTMSLLGFPEIIPNPWWIIRIWVMLRTNRPTNWRRQTSYPRRPTELAWDTCVDELPKVLKRNDWEANPWQACRLPVQRLH